MANAAAGAAWGPHHTTASEGRLFWLDYGLGQVMTGDTDGDTQTTLVTGNSRPDGIDVDLAGGKIYWSDMGLDCDGRVTPETEERCGGGDLKRSDLDGSNPEIVVPPGFISSPKQIHLDLEKRFIYHTDRGKNRFSFIIIMLQ